MNHQRTLKEGYLAGFMQDWVIEALIELMPKNETVKAISHNLVLRTEEYPLGYTVEILGIPNADDVRVEIYKNDPDIEPEDKQSMIKYKI